MLPLDGSGTHRTSGSSIDFGTLFDRWRVREGQTNTGMPMHVTLMSPFIDSRELDADVLDRLEGSLSRWASFECTLREVGTFPGPPRRAWLAPEPKATFVDMTKAIMAAFPGLLPYGGDHEEIRPHVTVAKERDPASFDATVRQIATDLPLRTWIEAFCIYELGEGGWTFVAGRPLTSRT